VEPTSGAAQPTNPLLAHLNDTDEAHASTRVDFAHPGETVQPMAAAKPAPAPETPKAPEAPVSPSETPPPPTAPIASPPKSPRNGRPIIVALVIIVLLAAIGGGAYWWLKIRKPSVSSNNPTSTQTITVTPIVPSNLAQKSSAGQTVAAGGSLKNPLELDFSMSTNANAGSIEPQVEVEPLGTAFTGQPNYKGDAVTPNGGTITAKVAVTDLKDGSYHWQARFAVGSQTSDYVAFSTTAGSADFIIDSTAPKAAAVTSVGSQAVKAGVTSLTTTQNPTTLAGTAEPGDNVAVAIAPDNQTATATADASGNWTVTLSAALANGQHTVAVTSTDPAGNTSNTSFTINSNTVAAAPATQTVAPTGDNTQTLTLIGLVLIAISTFGLILAGRRGQRRV